MACGSTASDMRRESELIRIYANDVLRACVYYLDDKNEAEKAFQETFEIALKKDLFVDERNLRVNLFRVVREVCGAAYFPDDGEEWLYLNYFNLSFDETAGVLNRKVSKRLQTVYSS